MKKNKGTGTPDIFEMIALNVQLKKQYEGANVKFKIFPEGADVNNSRPLAVVWGKNEGGKANAEWKYKFVYDPNKPQKAKPKFIFTAESFGCANVKAGAVKLGAEIDIICIDVFGQEMKDMEYKLHNEGKSGKTDAKGKVAEKNAIPGDTVLFKIK